MVRAATSAATLSPKPSRTPMLPRVHPAAHRAISPECTRVPPARRCYVDASACSTPYSTSVFFADLGLTYSYEACGSSNTFAQITSKVLDLVGITSRVEEYTCATKLVLE